MTLSNNEIAKVLCIACQDTIRNHSKRQLWRCLFRIQGTIVSTKLAEKIINAPEKSKTRTRDQKGKVRPSSI